MQGGGITGAHLRLPTTPRILPYCSCSFTSLGWTEAEEGGIFEKQNPTGLNVVFAITFDIPSHAT